MNGKAFLQQKKKVLEQVVSRRDRGLADSGRMHLYYHVGEDGKRCYTLKKKDPEGKPTVMPRPSPVVVCNRPLDLTLAAAQISAHPARFSPDDKFSQQRVTLKKRYNLLPTQQEELEL